MDIFGKKAGILKGEGGATDRSGRRVKIAGDGDSDSLTSAERAGLSVW